ncbi:hypothetical protein NQ315_000125 [Exocentrus adspersus]|uniref:Gamma-tubulin complex component n=1 Tax=Exocentrus adspersus TaxID=1586481 RepID=A0AAV8VQC9_9CUCU|nr:hypothetical protein NQ315_000125 [Exocentrus adspersus]
MSRQISEETVAAARDLIAQITSFQDDTDAFANIHKHILAVLKKSDTMYFLNKREVDGSVAGMAEKFNFHGFFPQAKALEEAYKVYVSDNLPKSELVTRLNVVKLLLCLSERPTSNFLENPEEFVSETVVEEEEIDWAEYLNEGIDAWNPNFDNESEESETSLTDEETKDEGNETGLGAVQMPILIDGTEKDTVVDLTTNREELLATVQHSWYVDERFFHAPFSNWREANIGILWDKFLEDQVKGLVPIETSCVLSEYKVIREVLWQMWSLHSSAVFELVGDRIKPKDNVTISSVRAEALENFLRQFVPYMEVLDYFREFSKSLDIVDHELIMAVPQTYRYYNGSLLNILGPVYKKLSQLEDTVREQETTYTLLNLADDLKSIMEPVMVLERIHKEAVIDFYENTRLRCATVLLSRLHDSLQYSVNKLEQDLRLTLFLESFQHYFTLVDAWLMKGNLSDYSSEFVIVNKNKNLYGTPCETGQECETSTLSPDSDNWKMKFELRDELDETCANNGMIRILKEIVLQIGRNIHLLRLLGKFSVVKRCKETIYEEFVRKTLEELGDFFGAETVEAAVEDEIFYDCVSEKKYKYPVVCTDECGQPTDMDKLENLVDTTDGFLMLAFEDYLVDKPAPIAKPEQTLFEKVAGITTTMFPTSNFFEKILNGMLRERFTISGLMVKNILIEEYLLEKQFQFLRHVFLFYDDMIFPFYRRLFEKTNVKSQTWGNDIWLSAHLQDTVMDAYPEFYDTCRVQVKETWRQCLDSLDACGSISVQYEVRWPLNIVITAAQMAVYQDIFRFVMKIKWALYTVNHLVFTDLEPKTRESLPRASRVVVMRLKYLKFALTHLLNSLQHYVFCFVFTRCLQKFELDFEKANDLASIMASHADFIGTVYAMVMDMRRSGSEAPAFKNVMECVKLLKLMWKRSELATPERLRDCYRVYKRAFAALDPIVCPVYIF